MPSSQQKPKVKLGERNSSRPNRKARKKGLGVKFDQNGVRLVGKGKPTGKSIVGISVKRVEAWAKQRNVGVDVIKAQLVAERDYKKAAKKAIKNSAYKARLAARDEGSAYRDRRSARGGI